MENNALIDALPLWGLFIAILGVVLISVECGYRLGKFRLSRREQEKEAPVGTMVGATLGLLAFILAFTFGLASSRFDNRRQLLLDEANALGTTYLRAGMLPEWGEEVRRLLRDYIGHRLDAVRSGDVTEGIRRSENIQQQVWTEAETVAQKNLNSIVVGLFSFRSRWCYCAKIIMAVAVAFLLVASASRLPAVLVPGRDRLRQARHPAAAVAAAAAGAVAEEAADYKRPAFSLVGRALHPLALHHLGALSADAVLVVHLREVGPAQRHPSVPACRTGLVDPDPAVDFVEAHFAVDVAPRRVVALADGAAPAAATALPPKPMAVLLSLLRLVGLPHRVLAIARRFGLGLCRVLAARANHLHAVRLDGVRHRDVLVRLVFLLGPGKAPCVLRLPEALPSLRGVAARRACLFHARPVPANRLTMAPLLHPEPPDRPSRRAFQAYPPDRDLRPLDLSLEPAPGCPPRARQHELAAEYSLDFRL